MVLQEKYESGVPLEEKRQYGKTRSPQITTSGQVYYKSVEMNITHVTLQSLDMALTR